MKKSLGIIVLLWIFYFFVGTPAGRISSAQSFTDDNTTQSEICSISAALKCTDISSSGQNIATSIASPVRYIPRGTGRPTISADRYQQCLHGISAHTHPEWHGHNVQGQFGSSNLPYSICHLLI